MHTIDLDRAIHLTTIVANDRRIRPDHELAAYRDLLLDLKLLADQPCRPGR